MLITLKLFASLAVHLPVEARSGNRVSVEVRDGATITEIIAPYALPEALVHLVLVNGTYIAPQDRAGRALVDGDVLAIWPPIAGG